MQGTGGGLIWHTTLALARWDWQRQLKSSFMTASLQLEIWTWDLQNTEKCTCLIETFCVAVGDVLIPNYSKPLLTEPIISDSFSCPRKWFLVFWIPSLPNEIKLLTTSKHSMSLSYVSTFVCSCETWQSSFCFIRHSSDTSDFKDSVSESSWKHVST